MLTNYKTHFYALLLLLCCGTSAAFAGEYNINENGIAIHGYDPMAYFDGKVLPGDPAIQANHKGALFFFADTANKNKFQAKPEQYAPQFGGYCSYGVRMGKKLDIDPEAYAVIDNKLYLLLNRSTKELWDLEQERNIAIANSLWPSVKPVPADKLNNSK